MLKCSRKMCQKKKKTLQKPNKKPLENSFFSLLLSIGDIHIILGFEGFYKDELISSLPQQNVCQTIFPMPGIVPGPRDVVGNRTQKNPAHMGRRF